MIRKRLVHFSHKLLQNIPRHARPGINRRQNKQRLKHNRVVIPVAHQPRHPRNPPENLRHSHRQRNRSACPPRKLFSHLTREQIQVYRVQSQLSKRLRRHINSEIIPRKQRASRDQRKHRHQALRHHRSVPDESRVALLVQHLRRRPRTHQRMKSGNRAARDRHEQKRKQRALDNRPAAMHILGQRRKLDVRVHDKHANHQQRNRPQLHIRRQIIPRLQQQPHRQHRRHKSVNRHQVNNLVRRKCQRRRPLRPCKPVSAPNARQQQHHANRARHAHLDLSRRALEHVQPHENRNRNRHPDREHAPRTVRQRVHHHHSQPRQRHQQNQQHRKHRYQSRKLAHLRPRHVRQRSSLVPHRSHQHDKILHATRQHRSDQYPQKSGRKSKLRRQRRPHQRSCSRNRREMMPEQNPLRRRHVVMSIFVRMRRRLAPVVQRQRLRGNKRAVIPISNRIHTKRRQQDWESIHWIRLFFCTRLSINSLRSPLRPKSVAVLSQLPPPSVKIIFTNSRFLSSARLGVVCVSALSLSLRLFSTPHQVPKPVIPTGGRRFLLAAVEGSAFSSSFLLSELRALSLP